MTRIWILIGTIILASCAKTQPKRSTAEFDTVLKAAVDTKKVPGVVAIVATGKEIVYEGAASMDKDTIFAIASMTKPVTSVAIMQLVEAGKIKLDEPASVYAPELAKSQVLDGARMRAPKSPVTVGQLLTHTSGFGYEFMNSGLFAAVRGGKIPSALAGGDGFLRAPLLFDPGQKWEYGISTDWLGRIVELVSGKKLDEYFQANIFDPLGMKDSFFKVPDEKKARVAKLSQRKEDGSLQEQPASTRSGATFLSGGGGLFSTASDYIRFTQAILNGGQLGDKRILKAETVALMGQNHIGELNVQPLRSMAPAFAADNASLPAGLDKFGYGFALNSKAIDKGRSANTMAWAGIFNTFFWIDREKNVCAVLMSQMSPGLELSECHDSKLPG
ncbi:MAG: beta-lactamase family protein [Candidatus Solibacter usitatus]|nr:beta-lactamase family protein [Candidatus Solibacter usitatus]